MNNKKFYEPEDFLVPVGGDYLRKGDRFVARKASPYAIRLISGIADMDGHRVSSQYGLRVGNRFYIDNPTRNYINVKLDGHGNYGMLQNESLLINDWEFLVDKHIAERIKVDVEFNQNLAKQEERAKLEDRKRSLADQLGKLNHQIAEIETELRSL